MHLFMLQTCPAFLQIIMQQGIWHGVFIFKHSLTMKTSPGKSLADNNQAIAVLSILTETLQGLELKKKLKLTTQNLKNQSPTQNLM